MILVLVQRADAERGKSHLGTEDLRFYRWIHTIVAATEGLLTHYPTYTEHI
jgi:hypothetical protein